jgi:hypothetical protein
MNILKNKLILGSIAIGTISLIVAYSAPIADIWRGIATIPFIGAIFSILLKLILDELAHQRQKEMLIHEQNIHWQLHLI